MINQIFYVPCPYQPAATDFVHMSVQQHLQNLAVRCHRIGERL
jgi:hypothetical protein